MTRLRGPVRFEGMEITTPTPPVVSLRCWLRCSRFDPGVKFRPSEPVASLANPVAGHLPRTGLVPYGPERQAHVVGRFLGGHPRVGFLVGLHWTPYLCYGLHTNRLYRTRSDLSREGRTTQDQALVDAFLKATEKLSLREIGDSTPISYGTAQNWRADQWKRLEAKTRRDIEEWLGAQPARESPTYAEGYSQAIQDVRAHLDALEAKLPPMARLPSDPESIAVVSDRARPTVSPAKRRKKGAKRTRGE